MALTIEVRPDPPIPGDEVCVVVGGPGPGRPTVTVVIDGDAQPLPSTSDTPGTVLEECFTLPANTAVLEIQAMQPPCPPSQVSYNY